MPKKNKETNDGDYKRVNQRIILAVREENERG